MISDVKRSGNLIGISMSDIGYHHEKDKKPNQDSVCIGFLEDDFLIAVSDGVGSCSKADIGSKTVISICKQLFEEIRNNSIEFNSSSLIDEIISRWMKEFGNECNDYCATLNAVFKLKKCGIMLSLGDGFVAVTSGGMRLISPDDRAAFTNETKCLNSKVTPEDFWSESFSFDTYSAFAIVACTDGVANALVKGNELDFVEEIEHIVCNDELESELTELMNDISKYSFDDRTIGVIKYERDTRQSGRTDHNIQ